MDHRLKHLTDPWSWQGRWKLVRSYLKKRPNKTPRASEFIENVHQSEEVGKPRVLLVYLVQPFLWSREEVESWRGHSNALQSLEMAEAFQSRGYLVDVIDFNAAGLVPKKKYQVVCGFGPAYEIAARENRAHGINIFYGTGAYWEYENKAEREAFRRVSHRIPGALQWPERTKPNDGLTLSDAVIQMGNEFNLSTFPSSSPPILLVPNFATLSESTLILRDASKARRHFLWLGSTGLVHKGLDTLLEIFSSQHENHLWVCGPLMDPREKEFLKAYRRELFYCSNIHTMGWVDPASPRMTSLAALCGFSILASCSEGCAGSVLNSMQMGLIPIVNRQSGVDVGESGIVIPDDTTAALKEAIELAAGMGFEVMERKASEAVQLVRDKYTRKDFRTDFDGALDQVPGINKRMQSAGENPDMTSTWNGPAF